MTTFFTSDTHFGHKNIIRYCNRPFTSVDEMDSEIIRRWNSVVSSADAVYHLGDFCFHSPDKYLRQLNGNLIILPGSHDKNLKGYSVLSKDHFYLLNTPPIGQQSPTIITLCHYAMRSWPLSHYASWHLFGHHHGKLEPYGLSFDVGVDCWNFTPVSLEKIAQKMKTLKPIVDYSKQH